MEPTIHPKLTVAEVLSQWPETIPIFLHHKMTCIGCSMSRFDTLEDVTAIYNLPLNRFLHELEQAVGLPLSKPSQAQPHSKGRYT